MNTRVTVTRRQFTGTALGTMGATLLGQAASAGPAPATPAAPWLPVVRWGKYTISRVLVGHNPLKGQSHFSAELSREMTEYFAADAARARQLLSRCEQLGINTGQMGSPRMEEVLRAHYAEGGTLQWIATFYSKPGEGKDELARILKMQPRPIGVQHFGNTSDALMRSGKIDRARETLKMLRDSGLLVGLCSHNHEVIDYAENKGWDVDFYQCCLYRSAFGLAPDGQRRETYEEADRQAMLRTIRQVSKPCIAYKVLAANRHCGRPADVAAAIRFAIEHIKPSDVILLGMWQKYKDQVAENVGYARKSFAALR